MDIISPFLEFILPSRFRHYIEEFPEMWINLMEADAGSLSSKESSSPLLCQDFAQDVHPFERICRMR